MHSFRNCTLLSYYYWRSFDQPTPESPQGFLRLLRQHFASKNLIIGITGPKETTRVSETKAWPCYTFVDNGEGQNPINFEKTFLSLSEGNKKDIMF